MKANLDVNHYYMYFSKEGDVYKSLRELLIFDDIMSEDQAGEIVDEYIQKNGLPNSIKSYREAATEITKVISDQEYFGKCKLTFMAITHDLLSVVFVTGG